MSTHVIAIEQMFEEMSGKLESFYYTFCGEVVYLIAELPDDLSTAAVGLKVNGAGLAKVKITALLTAIDIDNASKIFVNYQHPGKELTTLV